MENLIAIEKVLADILEHLTGKNVSERLNKHRESIRRHLAKHVYDDPEKGCMLTREQMEAVRVMWCFIKCPDIKECSECYVETRCRIEGYACYDKVQTAAESLFPIFGHLLEEE